MTSKDTELKIKKLEKEFNEAANKLHVVFMIYVSNSDGKISRLLENAKKDITECISKMTNVEKESNCFASDKDINNRIYIDEDIYEILFRIKNIIGEDPELGEDYNRLRLLLNNLFNNGLIMIKSE